MSIVQSAGNGLKKVVKGYGINDSFSGKPEGVLWGEVTELDSLDAGGDRLGNVHSSLQHIPTF